MATLKVEVPENSQNIIGTVRIDAPLEKVFAAYVQPELVKKWWARGNEVELDEFTPMSGGAWRLTEKAPDGNYGFAGTFHEVAANERIVQTFEFMGMPERGHVLLEKNEFVKIDDNTTEIRTISTAQSQADRDAMIESGMEAGWRQSVEALGKLVEEN